MKTSKTISRNPFWWCSIALCVAVFVFAGNRPFSETPQRLATFSGPTMGTRYRIKVVDLPSSVDLQTLKEDVRQKLDKIDTLMSTYQPSSELSRLNRFDRAEWFPVSRQTASVIGEALRIGQFTGGAFDVTVGPLVNLWTFGPGKSTAHGVPSSEEIKRTKGRVGSDQIEVRLSPPAVRKKRRDLYIDLSGIAKGFAVDQIAHHLQRCVIENYMIEVGGELRAKGHNHQGKPWRIAVESPVADTRKIQRIIALEDLAMATSGDYRNYFEKSGIRYSHIIDPRSGQPVCHQLASVTVLATSCMQADALATALMVLGPDDGCDLALREGITALFVIKSDTGFVEKSTLNFQSVLQ